MRDEWTFFGRTKAVQWCVGIGAILIFLLSVFSSCIAPFVIDSETQQQFEWDFRDDFEWEEVNGDAGRLA